MAEIGNWTNYWCSLTLLDAGGEWGVESAPPYHINVVPRKMLKEKVANFW